jgi:hypothetical protein
MIEYKGQINLPNANLGVTERTITANEDCRTCDTQALAREISHASHNLIPEQVANMVLENFCKAAVEKMSEGLAIQLNNGSDVALRIFPDIHLKCGNINLKRAKELTDNQNLTEQEMVDMAGELIDKVGVTVSVRAVAQRKFTELLEKEEYQLKRTGIITKTATASDTQEENGGTQQGGDNGSNTGNGGSDNGSNEEGDQN